MSNTEKVFGAVKAIMLMQERFDGIDKKILRLEDDLSDVGKSHSELAQRVAVIEGYIRGRADQAAMQPRIAKD
jgi:predicted methyltransferase